MGEWSKKVGEHGEKVVKEFFDLIGWSSSQDGVEMLYWSNRTGHFNERQ